MGLFGRKSLLRRLAAEGFGDSGEVGRIPPVLRGGVAPRNGKRVESTLPEYPSCEKTSAVGLVYAVNHVGGP